jgi:YidC/Oxa1 family membrane protein insertase
MSKMSKMGPEMERLKKKYGENKEELNKAMMVFYKEQGITPILGCLPMFLQMPIWIALWSSLQSTFELRHAPFLWGLTWIKDLAQPDRLLFFPKTPINLYFTSVDAINLLPILMGLVFYIQQKMTPKAVAMTPEQAQQQKMMQWMSLLFPVLLYTGPSGLNLYILTSTAIGIWESKRVRDHIQAQEEAEKAGKVIVDAKATRASRRHAKEEHAEDAKKTGGIMGWIGNLQKKAEEVRDATDRRDKGKK